ncbi:hypothetical protein K491DRAFT_669161 [Lophiostoma macrostomum CBS 122681]|uniref:Something about silencing protein 4 domain-containing protein n=1 Tax=Lophiostoma macrostomum CBS 122681 TaxID=1314788 RepID=A0A6A6SQS3_9PLEO|nr:hypothetical protein K491DRAFT_669161 [Lophiostoma macrostomum CBS 122681]
MANPTRPPLRSSTERRARAKSPATDDIENNAHDAHAVSVSTRRASRGAPLLALDNEKPSKVVASQRPANSAGLARTSSRKRPATALNAADATSDTARPPTKVTVTQPHGHLVRITNGVPAALGIAADDVPSGVWTPKTNGAPAALTVPAQTPATQTQDKRSLRSHDGGSRMKSDLAIYFSNYDDVIAGVPKSPEFLDLGTSIYIIDEPSKSTKPPNAAPHEGPRTPSASPSRSRKSRQSSLPRKASVTSIPPSQSSTMYQVLDYTTIARHLRNDGSEDPLAESVFIVQHRRAERKEKQLRNIEKERAMHEKVQLERLLDGLQGPDWLKVMGITGVTDGERKDWEPKRDYFVKEVESLVDKFRIWKEEEKRLRAEKEAAHAAREGDEDEDEDTSESDVANVNGAAPSASEQREKVPRTPQPRRPPRPHGFLLPVMPPQPQSPFKSFFAKPHLRAAALGKHRHGRNAAAFGQPIPDFYEHEFEPPEEYLTPEALRDHARKRRRQKRESGAPT